MARVTITRIADGTYCVEQNGRNEIIFVAGSPADRWIFWNGQVFRGDFRAADPKRAASDSAEGRQPGAGPEAGADKGGEPYHVRPTSVMAPMPARVSKLLAPAGSIVKKGETLLVLEAMKMELPVRAPADGTVTAVHCREGELVATDTVLMELT
jgi:biotin carboxyl carrier protein